VDQEKKMKQYYTCFSLMQEKYDRFTRDDRFLAATTKEFAVWKEKTRTLLRELTGMNRMLLCDAMPVEEEEELTKDNIIRKKIRIQTEPGVYMPCYLLIPTENRRYHEKNKKPLTFLALPGHLGGGKESIAGRKELPGIIRSIEQFHYDYGYQLALRGFTVFCPDCRGFGERREEALQGEEEEKYLNGTCYQLSHMAEALGETVIGMQAFDVHRLIDYIEQQGIYDMEELGCIGFSGGGMQTLWSAALDDRIKRCIISGYMYGYRDSLLELNGNCSCNYVPHLFEHLDMGDIGALLAPRQVVIQSCLDDHLNGKRGISNVYEQVAVMRQAYRLFDKEDRLVHDIQGGGHCWHEEALSALLKDA